MHSGVHLLPNGKPKPITRPLHTAAAPPPPSSATATASPEAQYWMMRALAYMARAGELPPMSLGNALDTVQRLAVGQGFELTAPLHGAELAGSPGYLHFARMGDFYMEGEFIPVYRALMAREPALLTARWRVQTYASIDSLDYCPTVAINEP